MQSTDQNNNNAKPKLIEDDDDFEEFEDSDWQDAPNEQIDVKQWLEDWDDEDADDEFTEQLREEIKIQ